MAGNGTSSDENKGDAHPFTCTVQQRWQHCPIKLSYLDQLPYPCLCALNHALFISTFSIFTIAISSSISLEMELPLKSA